VTGPAKPPAASELDDSLLSPWPAAEEFRYHFSHVWLDRDSAEGDLMELNGWTSPQMLRRYGPSARSARARHSYDRVMDDTQ
jgi:hypothetical protein